MHLARLVRLTPLALALALVAGRASAQAADSVTYRNAVGVNPIGLPLGFFSAEFEHVVQPGFVVGVGGSYENLVGASSGDTQSSWLDAKVKYYPNEESFKGFSVGLTAGVLNSRGNQFNGFTDEHQNRSAGTVGVIVDYNWLLGKRKKLYIGTGIGAKRVFGDTGDRSILDPVYPYGRLQLGIAY